MNHTAAIIESAKLSNNGYTYRAALIESVASRIGARGLTDRPAVGARGARVRRLASAAS